MLFVGIVMNPRDPKVSAFQAALGAALPFALLILAISFGFTILTFFMDKQKEKEEAQK
jgi:hypothetical protein